jgi:predicted Zn-dependent peptidase
VLAERHEVPLVNFILAADAGYASDSPRTRDRDLRDAVLTDGTRTRNALQISDELETLGAQLRGYSNLDLSFISLSALKREARSVRLPVCGCGAESVVSGSGSGARAETGADRN